MDREIQTVLLQLVDVVRDIVQAMDLQAQEMARANQLTEESLDLAERRIAVQEQLAESSKALEESLMTTMAIRAVAPDSKNPGSG